jgi:ribonuclease HI
MELKLDATITVLLISKISSTCFGQTTYINDARSDTNQVYTVHPLAVATRLKTIKLINSTSITFHWVKGHAGLKGNERADYLAKRVASYNTTIAYDEIPVNRGKQILEY